MPDLQGTVHWLARRRRAVITVTVLVAAACLALATRLGLERDILALLPRNDPVVSDYVGALEHLRRLDQILIDVSTPGEMWSARTTSVADDIAEGLALSPHVAAVTHRLDLEALASAHRLLRSRRASLFSPVLAEATALLIREGSVEDRLDRVRRQMTELPDPVAVELFRLDPLGLDGPLMSLLPPPPGVAGGARIVDGRLWSSDGEHLLMLAEPSSTDLDGDSAVAVNRAVAEVVDQATARSQGATRASHLSRYRAAAENERIIRADVTRTLWVSVLGISALLLIAFRRWRLVPLLLLPPLFGGVVAVAALAGTFGRVSPVVVGCGSILLGISIDYAIHLVFRLEHTSADDLHGRARAVADTARPMLLAAGTTAAAFLTMLLSSLPGHRQLGIFAAAAVIAAATFTLLVLHLFPSRDSGRTEVGASWLTRVGTTGLGRWWALALVAVASVVTLPGLSLLRIETDLDRFNAMGEAARADFDDIQTTWGSPLGRTSLVVRGASADEALSRAGALAQALQEEQTAGRVIDFQSAVGLLPDERTQEENRQRWLEFWSPDRVAAVRASTERAMRERGFQPAAVADSWAALGNAGPPLEPGDLEAGPLGRLLEDWLVAGAGGETWVMMRSTFAPETEFEEMAGRLKQVVPDLLVADGRQAMARISTIVYRELKRMSLLAFVIVLAVLLPASRSWRTPLLVVAILLTTFFWSLGALGLAGIPISMMNCMLAIFVFGLTVDYAVFLIHARSLPSAEAGLTSSAVVLSSLTTLIGFGALLLADHPSLASIGATTVIGVACGLVAAFALVSVFSPPRSHG